MQRALYVNEHYFGKSDARSVKVLIELGALFKKSGDIRSAREQYKMAYDHMKAMPYQDKKLLSKIADAMKRVDDEI